MARAGQGIGRLARFGRCARGLRVAKERKTSAPSSAEDGFSVLEAIVALAILGAALVPILTWQSQMARDVVALERSLEGRVAEEVALGYLQLLNPRGPMSGEQNLGGGWNLQWTAEPVTERQGLRYALKDVGRHSGALYSIKGQLRAEGGQVITLSTRVMGIEELQPFEPF